MDLSKFEEGIKTVEGGGGRLAWPPQLLISIWVYSYTLGVASARVIERMMGWEAGPWWLSGAQTMNHHTLSSYRVEHGEALGALFAQQLAGLEKRLTGLDDPDAGFHQEAGQSQTYSYRLP